MLVRSHVGPAGVRAVAVVMTLALLAGCRGAYGTRPDDPDRRGLLAAVAGTSADRDSVVGWIRDEYDRDKRYRGLLILLGSPAGSTPEALPLYRQAIEDADPIVRSAAVRALGRHGTPADVPTILAQLKPAGGTDDAEVPQALRWEVAQALQRVHHTEAIDALVSLVDVQQEPDADVRSAAAVALGQYSDSRAAGALIRALDDTDLQVAVTAQRSLVTMLGIDRGLDAGAYSAALSQGADAYVYPNPFEYPAFRRSRLWYEWFYFWQSPPRERPGVPTGMLAQVEG
ncbi:MAG: HEAT repeat domain-containing protein [Planctomycetota bacterium]